MKTLPSKALRVSGGVLTIKRESSICSGTARFFDPNGIARVNLEGVKVSPKDPQEMSIIGKHKDKTYSLFKIKNNQMSWLTYGLSEEDIPNRDQYKTLGEQETIDFCDTRIYAI